MSKSKYVFSLATTLVVDGSGRHHLRAGDAWHADHPLVQAHPDWFSDEPLDVKPRGWEPKVEVKAEPEPRVEQATKAPGEKRNTRRAN